MYINNFKLLARSYQTCNWVHLAYSHLKKKKKGCVLDALFMNQLWIRVRSTTSTLIQTVSIIGFWIKIWVVTCLHVFSFLDHYIKCKIIQMTFFFFFVHPTFSSMTSPSHPPTFLMIVIHPSREESHKWSLFYYICETKALDFESLSLLSWISLKRIYFFFLRVGFLDMDYIPRPYVDLPRWDGEEKNLLLQMLWKSRKFAWQHMKGNFFLFMMDGRLERVGALST